MTIPSESEPLPEELKVPVGIADGLLEPAGTSSTSGDGTGPTEEVEAVAESSEEAPGSNGNEQEVASLASTLTPRVPHVGAGSGGGLLGFLNTYNNRLGRFSLTGNGTDSNNINGNTTRGNNGDGTELPGGLGDMEGGAATVDARGRQFPLSTVLVVGLIAFLIGSLLRSLVSPGDFVYFVTDARELEGLGGWREMRRVVEMQYVAGGWDLQVAVVRRH
ncbi:hypothetical protein C0993_011593 [Termitomyces sp. T159_Od127]|nr:hypothetical protein C0993_011593 [Termitomyces sp. T159_Od127]